MYIYIKLCGLKTVHTNNKNEKKNVVFKITKNLLKLFTGVEIATFHSDDFLKPAFRTLPVFLCRAVLPGCHVVILTW